MKVFTCTIESIKGPNEKGWSTAKTDIGNLSIPPDKSVKAGTTYQMEVIEKEGAYGLQHILGKVLGISEQYKTEPELNGKQEAALPKTTSPQPPATAAYGKNDTLMARLGAQKNSALLTDCYVKLIVASGQASSLSEAECKLWAISFYKATYEQCLKELNG